MGYLLLKAALSGIIIATVSEVARRAPGIGALVASVLLISVLGMIWLWRGTGEPVRMAHHAYATFWFVLPSLPMFLLIPWLLSPGTSFWASLATGCVLTGALYVAMIRILGRFALEL